MNIAQGCTCRSLLSTIHIPRGTVCMKRAGRALSLLRNDGRPGPRKSFRTIAETLKRKLEEPVGQLHQLIRQYFPHGVHDSGGSGGGNHRFDRGSHDGDDEDDDGDDEKFLDALDEMFQRFLALMGLIFAYAYIIRGREMVLLARDWIRHTFFRGEISLRLKEAKRRWDNWYSMGVVQEDEDDELLGKAILNTTTTWDSPKKYRKILAKQKKAEAEALGIGTKARRADDANSSEYLDGDIDAGAALNVGQGLSDYYMDPDIAATFNLGRRRGNRKTDSR